jgi:hypothetical protein
MREIFEIKKIKTFKMTFLDLIINNYDAVVFYSLFVGVAGGIDYSFARSYISSFYPEKVDANVQTDAWENYSDRPSQLASDVTSIDTMTPRISPTEHFNSSQLYSETGTQTLTDGASTATTVLPIPPINIEVIPNPDLIINQPWIIDGFIQNSEQALKCAQFLVG